MNTLLLEIEDFYSKLQNGEYDYPLSLATILQRLADKAWDQVEQMQQPALRIDP